MRLLAFVLAAALLGGCTSVPKVEGPRLLARHHFIEHVSTAPINRGETVRLHLYEKSTSGADTSARNVASGKGVVLFVHGATVPVVPDFDLPFKDYSWMNVLARAGFVSYGLDHTGYGLSPRPGMDDPCNVEPKQQDIVIPRPLAKPCAPNAEMRMTTLRSDLDEIDRAVEFLRARHGVGKVHLIGWSAGGPRAGAYAALYPQKVERLVLFAPSPPLAKLSTIAPAPAKGAPMSLQTREDLEKLRWDPDVRCEGQVEPGLRDALWAEIMRFDAIGSQWGPKGSGVMRGRIATAFGWTPDLARKVEAPTLIMVGEFDRLEERKASYEMIGAQDKVFLGIACASHFMNWESQHKVLHEASRVWLEAGSLNGVRSGMFSVGRDGQLPGAK